MKALRFYLLTCVFIGALLSIPLTGCNPISNNTDTVNSSHTRPPVITPSEIPDSSQNKPGHANLDDPKPKQPVLVTKGSQGNTALYLNEALAHLNYLPVTFTLTNNSRDGQKFNQDWSYAAAHKEPLPGTFTWKNETLKSILGQSFASSSFSTVTEGAIMTYQATKGLTIDGIAGPQVWNSLESDLANHQSNQNGYINITVEKRQPQQLKVWRDGKVIYSSLANTGVSAAPTPNGTWPIYLRFTSQTMEGVTPWGEQYSDTGVPYVSYFHGGDAIHGFWRKSFGWPQSLGCVELPVSNAKTVYSLVAYGTLVTICNSTS